MEGVNFEAEFLTKKTKEDKEYADVIKTMSDLELDPTYLKKNKFLDTSYILIRIDLERNNVPQYMKKSPGKDFLLFSSRGYPRSLFFYFFRISSALSISSMHFS